METQQPTYNPILPPSPVEPKSVGSSVRASNSSSSKTKFLVIGAIILSLVLSVTAYTMGVRKSKEKNPAYLDPITVLKNTLFPPKINMTGPPGLPGGWSAPMPSPPPTIAPFTQ